MAAPVPQLVHRDATRAASLAPPLDGRIDLVIIRGVNLLASDFGGAALCDLTIIPRSYLER